jgi:hypothetical protein
MRTDLSEASREDGAQSKAQDEGRPPRAFRPTPTTEAHWDELHGASSRSPRHLLSSLRGSLRQRAWTDLAVGIAAGFAAGWLLSSRHRSHAVRDLIAGSLLPAASRRMHHAYDALRGNGTLRDWGHRVSNLKSRW